MFAVGHVFGEIIGAWCGRGEPARFGVDVPDPASLLEVALARCMVAGLDVQPAPAEPVRHLIVPDGDGTRTLERRSVYGLCSLDSVQAAMLAVIDHVRAREGAGRIWFCGRPNYLNRRGEADAGTVATRLEGRESVFPDPPVFTPTGDGSRRVLIGAYYFYAPAVAAPTIETPWLKASDGYTCDPLDVKYDGMTLRYLLDLDEVRQRAEQPHGRFKLYTPIQREAISAHWSAHLRAKIAASTAAEVQRDRGRVACDPLDLED